MFALVVDQQETPKAIRRATCQTRSTPTRRQLLRVVTRHGVNCNHTSDTSLVDNSPYAARSRMPAVASGELADLRWSRATRTLKSPFAGFLSERLLLHDCRRHGCYRNSGATNRSGGRAQESYFMGFNYRTCKNVDADRTSECFETPD